MSRAFSTVAPAFVASLLAAPCVAGDAAFVPTGRLTLPETMLLPFAPVAAGSAQIGWIVVHQNTATGPHAPRSERVFRSVNLDDGTEGHIAIRVERTRNDACRSDVGGGCPDLLRILSLPPGFMAVPDRMTVEEGATRRILVVPALTV
jgi:hypothetical protein